MKNLRLAQPKVILFLILDTFDQLNSLFKDIKLE